MSRLQLPIDEVLPRLGTILREAQSLVLEAPPGSGKTTRVPPYFLNQPYLSGREILVLEPRRLAAKMAANRVAEELGEDVGATVGYQFRFESVGGAQTRIRFLTEGMFLRRMMGDAQLQKAGLVIIDEFHERHLQGDLALGLVRNLQAGPRKDLKLIVMSATLDGEAIAKYLGAERVQAEGRRFSVDIEYAGEPGGAMLDDRVASAAVKILETEPTGDILAFLPGVGEINRAHMAVKRLMDRRGLGDAALVLPLYADLPRDQQDIAVKKGRQRKIVLSTNVAETSITIDGVTAVIDGGVARVAALNPWSGLPVLRLSRISQASATQRAGRAGRTAPGKCIRLYSASDFQGRPAFESAEIQRLDLAGPLVELAVMGLTPLMFPWFEAPPESALRAAQSLLFRLGAFDEAGKLTALGKQMSMFPAHPRLARLAVEAERLGVAWEGCTAAAWLGEQPGDEPDNEIAGLVEALAKQEKSSHAMPARRTLDRARRQFLQALPTKSDRKDLSLGDKEKAIRKSVLAAFPDRVARVRALDKTISRNKSGESVEVVLCGGGSARLLNPHLPTGVEFVVALDAEERTQGGLKGDVRLRLVGAIEPDWLLDIEPMGVEETVEAVWNDAQKRAEVRTRLMYEKLVISESAPTTLGEKEIAAAEALLFRKAKEAGMSAFVEPEKIAEWKARLAFVRGAMPEAEFPAFDEAAVLQKLCAGQTKFKDIREGDPAAQLAGALTPAQRTLLEKCAPLHLAITGARRVTVHYDEGKPPWIESRLQDFFGMKETPKVAEGRVPVTVHLLAPNKRALQVTSDLAGFWERHYPAVRRELSRRYPKHAWPENPITMK